MSAEEPVPSVLPEEGLDLHAEIDRYKAWIIDQAMARAGSNHRAAAKLIGFTTEGLLYALRARGVPVQTRRYRRSAPAARLPEPATLSPLRRRRCRRPRPFRGHRHPRSP